MTDELKDPKQSSVRDTEDGAACVSKNKKKHQQSKSNEEWLSEVVWIKASSDNENSTLEESDDDSNDDTSDIDSDDGTTEETIE